MGGFGNSDECTKPPSTGTTAATTGGAFTEEAAAVGALGAAEAVLDLAALMEERVLREEVGPAMEFAFAAFGAVAAAAPLEAEGGRWLEAREGKSPAVALY